MRICLIGAGNVATQLGIALREMGHQIVQVWSQTSKSAARLSEILKAPYTTELNSLVSDAEIYILAVKDYAIEPILASHNWGQNLVVHTAGSIPISVFEDHCTNFGVFYPFQTFSVNKKVSFDNLPLCIEANSKKNLNNLFKLASTLSYFVRQYDSVQRQQLHLAAVFACNFVNHLYFVGNELLEEKGIAFEILIPLILETASKVISQNPKSAQTGPAVRNDEVTLNKHLELLKDKPDLQTIYNQISKRIIETYK